MNIKTQLDKNLNFPVGTMFWCRSEKLSTLINMELTWNDYPKEPIPIDGTMLHAIERIIPFLESDKPSEINVINTLGITR